MGRNITVKVKPNSRKESIQKLNDNHYVVKVNAPPIDGAANSKVIELLSDYFKIPKSKILLIRGQTSKIKIFQLIDASV